MSDTTLSNEVVMTWSMEPDQQSVKETAMSFENMISLISDLAIIGKVAGEALGAVWEGLQDSINTGLAEFQDMSLGMTLGVDPEELLALQYAVEQIGGDGEAALGMLQAMDAMIQSFRNPATGAEELEKFFKTMGTFGKVDQDLQDKIQQAIENEDAIEALKLLGETRDDLGAEFSNFINEFDLGALAFLESDEQYQDWLKAWEMAGNRIFEVNEEALDGLQDGMSDFKEAVDAMTRNFNTLIGRSIEVLGAAMLTAAERFISWTDKLAESETGKAFGEWWSSGLENFGDLVSGEADLGETVKKNLREMKDFFFRRDPAFDDWDRTNENQGTSTLGGDTNSKVFNIERVEVIGEPSQWENAFEELSGGTGDLQ